MFRSFAFVFVVVYPAPFVIEAPFRFSAAHSFVSSRRMKAPFVLSFSMLLRSCILENHGNSSFLGLVSFCIYLFVVSLINLHFPCCCFFFFFFQHAFPLSMKRRGCWSRCPVWNHSAHFHKRKNMLYASTVCECQAHSADALLHSERDCNSKCNILNKIVLHLRLNTK